MTRSHSPSVRAPGHPNRREFLTAGGLSLIGLPLSGLLRAQATTRQGAGTPTFGRAKSCMVVFLKGGPSQLDTFDLKPDAPIEIRGEFRPVRTNVPGIHISEHLPKLARQADKFTILRSMVLGGESAHSTAAYEMTTGHRFPRAGEAVSSRVDHPHYGSVVSAIQGREAAVPAYAMLPEALVVNGEHRGGQHAGLLGARFDPFIPGGDPNAAQFSSVDLGLTPRVALDRLEDRRGLLVSLDRIRWEKESQMAAFDAFQSKAIALLTEGKARDAFNLDAEPVARRERYGRTTFGQSVLLGRRLIEAGTKLVHVNCMSSVLELEQNWDTHKNNFTTQRNRLLPRMDPAVAALFEDLDATGLLDETLVLVMGEFGRTPKINENAGRDHWPYCFSLLIGGAGIGRGRVYGASDAHGAFPTERPVTPGQLAATIYHALGIPPDQFVSTADGRPFRICEDSPVLGLWG